jgi:hypothetical protein
MDITVVVLGVCAQKVILLSCSLDVMAKYTTFLRQACIYFHFPSFQFHNNDCICYSGSNAFCSIRMINSRMMRWEDNVACMLRDEKCIWSFRQETWRRKSSVRLMHRWKMILKTFVKEIRLGMWTEYFGSGYGPILCSCERGNQLSGSINDKQFL